MEKYKPKFNQKKYEELIRYIIHQHAEISVVKLIYIMYQSDFLNYAHRNKSITGEIYLKTKKGIVGKHFNETIKKLKKSGELKLIQAVCLIK